MIVPVMAISNLVLTRQIYSEETNGAHAHYREPVPLSIDNETYDDDASQPRKTGPRVSFSAGKTQCSFSDR